MFNALCVPCLSFVACRLWNDRWFVRWGNVNPEQLGTLDAYAEFQGKHLIRGEAAVAFMHHRGELLPGSHEVGQTRCRYTHVQHRPAA